MQGPAWCALTTEQRTAARILGLTRRSWDAFPRRVRVPWDLFVEEEATAAATLGFTHEAWDAQLLPADLVDVGQRGVRPIRRVRVDA